MERKETVVDAGRKILLEILDWRYKELRKIVENPNWSNPAYPNYVNALKSLKDAAETIGQLNSCGMEIESYVAKVAKDTLDG